MSLESLTFVRPALVWLALLALPLGGLFVAASAARRRGLARFAGPGARLVSTSAARRALRASLLLVAVVALALAAAGPYADLREVEVRWKGADLVIALDVSQSMGAKDASPDRLRAAQAAIRTMVDEVPGARIALVLFGASGIVRYPATTDPKVLADALEAPGRSFRPSSGSSLPAAIAAALEALPTGSALPKAVVVVSDGEDLSGERPDLERYRAAAVRLYGLTVGTAAGAEVPTYDGAGKYLGPLLDATGAPVVTRSRDEPLASDASATGGRTWRYDGTAASVAPLAAALRSLGSGELAGGTDREPDDRYQLAAGVALAALLVEWIVRERRPMPRPRAARIAQPRRSALIGAILALVLLASCASSAATNETANGLFAAGDYQGALDRYRALQREHPDLAEISVNAGNALYRQADYDHAVSNYQAALSSSDRKVRAIALYDEGDALFRLGKLDEARAAYVEALRIDPSDRDAKFNIELVDRLRRAGQGPRQPGDQGGDQSKPGDQQAGPSASPGGGGNPQSGQQGAGSPGQQGKPGGDGAQPADELQQAIEQFRQDLTPDEALRLLDAMQRGQLGIQTFLDTGPSRRGQDPLY